MNSVKKTDKGKQLKRSYTIHAQYSINEVIKRNKELLSAVYQREHNKEKSK